MSGVKKWVSMVTVLAVILLLWLPLHAVQHDHKTKSNAETLSPSGTEHAPDFAPLPGPGKKVPIGKEYYFVYGFDKKPAMGTVIMRVEVYKKDGQRETSLEIKGDAGMPSMRGAHETGERSFKLSKSGVYLLPVDIVMPGDWEIKLTFTKAGKVIFRGSYHFDV